MSFENPEGKVEVTSPLLKENCASLEELSKSVDYAHLLDYTRKVVVEQQKFIEEELARAVYDATESSRSHWEREYDAWTQRLTEVQSYLAELEAKQQDL